MAEQSTRNTNEVVLIMDYASEIKSRFDEQDKILYEQNRMLERLIELMGK